MDKIFLSALSVECIVGIWEWERRVKQTVIIDVEMAADIRRAAASDHIDDTIDYKRVAKRLLEFVGESQFNWSRRWPSTSRASSSPSSAWPG